MDNNNLLINRLDLFEDVVAFKNTDRVPIAASISNWPHIDYDSSLSAEDVYRDYDILEKSVLSFQTRYEFDALNGAPVIYNVKNQDILKNSNMALHGNVVNFVDRCVIENADEYDEYYANPPLFSWMKVGPKYYSHLTYKDAKDYLVNTFEFMGIANTLGDKLINQCNVPLMFNTAHQIYHPLEMLAFTRGLKGLGVDMRRHSDKLKQIANSQADAWLAAIKSFAEEDRKYGYTFDAMASFLIHSIMNPKQFAELYWPLESKAFSSILENKKTCVINMEAEVIRLADFFVDYPRGYLAMMPEMESVTEIRKAIPNITILGGLPLEYLGKKSSAECIGLVNKTINEMGPGYIVCPNKMLTYENDCKRENLLAVCDFVKRFRY